MPQFTWRIGDTEECPVCGLKSVSHSHPENSKDFVRLEETKPETMEERFLKKFGLVNELDFGLREIILAFIKQETALAVKERDDFWAKQEMGKSDDCLKHCEEEGKLFREKLVATFKSVNWIEEPKSAYGIFLNLIDELNRLSQDIIK